MTEGGGRVSEGYPDEDPAGSFSFTVQRLSAGITIIWAGGELDSETSSQLYQLVSDELPGEPAQMVLELSDLTSVDPAAIDSLLSASGLAGESDISFCLVAPHASPVVAALAQAGLIERFEVFPTVRAATLRG